MVHEQAFPRQKDMQTPVAEPAPFRRQRPQSLAKRRVIRATRAIPIRLRRKTDQAASAALRQVLFTIAQRAAFRREPGVRSFL